MATVEDCLVIANPLPDGNGYTWTLASRLGEMISHLEAQFGDRDRSWTILGIEFCKSGPQTWFPGNCGHIIIQLSCSASTDLVQALFQLAHESVHLLDPTVFGFATVLEEGLATHFSLQYIKQFHPNYTTSDTKYATAAALVAQLLDLSPMVIKSLHFNWYQDFTNYRQSASGSVSSVTQVSSSCSYCTISRLDNGCVKVGVRSLSNFFTN